MRPFLFLFVAALLAASPSSPPHIFYSDLAAAANSGGQDNRGAFVNIYGRRFGSVRGTSSITVGNGPVVAYLYWSDTRVAFQLGPLAKSGPIVLHTSSGASNGIPFRIGGGKIFFVAPNGSDSANGEFAAPWRTLIHARDASHPGDIIYAMNGVSQVTDDGYGWSAALTLHADSGGTANRPKALIAYPGATVTVGSANGPPFGIRTTGPAGHWLVAGLVIRGAVAAVHIDGPSAQWRFVSNDMSCPNNITGSCFSTSKASYVNFLGNHVHDVGKPEASALNHGVYFSTDSNHIDAGWNTIENVRGCRGMQFHSTVIETGSGHNQFDISVHDNVIHDTQCDGIVLATVDPSKGAVRVWNNVIYNAGRGPANPERTGHWSCILIAGTTNAGAPGGGTVEVFNNTLYNCGSFRLPPYENARSGVANSGRNPKLKVRLRNNIVVTPAGVPYLTMWTGSTLCVRDACDGIAGSTNLFFGNGAAPRHATLTNSLNKDPLFINPRGHEFHLSPDSPACSTGIETESVVDADGIGRETRSGYGLGAFRCSQP